VRRLVLVLIGIYFALGIATLAAPSVAQFVYALLLLTPDSVLRHGYIWQLVTYPFLNGGILGFAFSLLTLWFTGAMLEDVRGSRWFTRLFYVSTVGGAVLTVLISTLPPLLTSGRVMLPHASPLSAVGGVSAPLFGLLVAFAVFFGEMEFLLFFVVRAKAKYVVILGALIYVAMLLFEGNAMWALLAICCGISGLAYAKMVARPSLANSASERWYGMRNAYTRWKRRRAARQFEVYMRKQNRVVKFDDNGRYIAPEDEVKNPQDRKWMN